MQRDLLQLIRCRHTDFVYYILKVKNLSAFIMFPFMKDTINFRTTISFYYSQNNINQLLWCFLKKYAIRLYKHDPIRFKGTHSLPLPSAPTETDRSISSTIPKVWRSSNIFSICFDALKFIKTTPSTHVLLLIIWCSLYFMEDLFMTCRAALWLMFFLISRMVH